MLLNARGGMLGSKMISHNIYHKKVTNVSFNYFNEFENYPRIDENPIYNNNRIDQEDNTIGSFPDARIFVHSTSSQGEHCRIDSMMIAMVTIHMQPLEFPSPYKKESKLLELNYGVNISMRVTGNTTLAVGQLINLIVPVTGRIHEKENDEYMTGKYLITKLRHIFSEPDRTHEVVLNACQR